MSFSCEYYLIQSLYWNQYFLVAFDISFKRELLEQVLGLYMGPVNNAATNRPAIRVDTQSD